MNREMNDRSADRGCLRHGLPIVAGTLLVIFAYVFAIGYRVPIADRLANRTPEELEWLEFGEWQRADATNTDWVNIGDGVEFRDSVPFPKLIYDVQVTQYKFELGNDGVYYRNEIGISINLWRATISGVTLACIWMAAWLAWSRLLP